LRAGAALLGGPVRRFTEQLIIKHGFITEEQGGRSYYHQAALGGKVIIANAAPCIIIFHW
jgi:hypothetical protein